MVLISPSPVTLSDRPFRELLQNPKATPFELDALLLLALPLLLTLQKLVELLPFGERSHQLFAEPDCNKNRA